MIQLRNILQHYGIRPILRDVDLEVRTGEVLVIMGPNGTGKTTLLGVMAGVLSPQRGEVEIDGRRRRASEEDELAIRRRVIYLPAEPWLPPGISGREFLMAVGRLYDIPDLHLMDHIDRLLRLFDLEAKQDADLQSLSSGQRKKIALASALVTEAPIMLLDEPFSGGLDPAGIVALKQVLKRLAARDDVTIVMTTPVPELVEELADRIALLREGGILACDTPDGLRRLAGCEGGSLEETLERLLNPKTIENLAHYFDGAAK